ncbi:MAG TPA: S1 RNA-binding domain-containing protein [Anaerolineae bacterium]|nr:S1 RNA-binding domain-containing protein [Anaerolineae bacterium]
MGMIGHSLESLSGFLEEAARRCEDIAGARSQAPSQSGERTEEQQAAHEASENLEERAGSSLDVDTAWQDAEQAYRDGQIVEGIVTGWNRGGLLVRWNDLQGFVPASQLKEVPIFEDEESRDEQLARWVGEELRLKVIELDRRRNRLVFSERATMWGPQDGDRLMAEITPGETWRGYVSNLCNFGAFVDLGGIDGLIHLSELSWGRVSHPREVLAIGQEIEVYVMSVDRSNRRIALSLKRLRPDPWTVVDETYHLGQLVSATITNVVDFGAFAQIEEGLEGLVHISELSEARVTHPSQVVKPGERVRVRILRIDSGHHRLGLSLRQAAEEQAPNVGFETRPLDSEWGRNSHLLY